MFIFYVHRKTLEKTFKETKLTIFTRSKRRKSEPTAFPSGSQNGRTGENFYCTHDNEVSPTDFAVGWIFASPCLIPYTIYFYTLLD